MTMHFCMFFTFSEDFIFSLNFYPIPHFVLCHIESQAIKKAKPKFRPGHKAGQAKKKARP